MTNTNREELKQAANRLAHVLHQLTPPFEYLPPLLLDAATLIENQRREIERKDAELRLHRRIEGVIRATSVRASRLGALNPLLDELQALQSPTQALQEGVAAGQTVEHLHLHLIPRETGDVAEPIGGIITPLAERLWMAVNP